MNSDVHTGEAAAESRPVRAPTLRDRASGVLLHITSLPGPRAQLRRELHLPGMRILQFAFAMASVAHTAIVPMQDLLGLGSEARMNRPGKAGGNWRWRFEAGAITPELEQRLLEFTRTYERGIPLTENSS